MRRFAELPGVGNVLRLGLATRGNTSLSADDVHEALARGVNWLNWCGHVDGLCEAVRELGPRRSEVAVAVQFSARTDREARRELRDTLRALNTEYLDAVTYYYVEQDEEWEQIIGPGGAAETVEAARREGVVRAIGLTSHQRRLAAKWVRSGRLDLLMVRYNAAHRGAEHDVFPVTRGLSVPVVAFTCQRWGALCRPTPDDPPGRQPPAPREWYRFVLSCPDVSVALMAPQGRAELEENLTLLDDWRACSPEEWEGMASHGDRVKRHAGAFP
jgi:predicted aldo/keto reductase-like oxidoreductase